MPWELRIVNAADAAKPLGDRADVIARVAAALPGVELELDPVPPPEWIAEMPPALGERHATRQPQLRADFQGDGFSFQFSAGDRRRPSGGALGALRAEWVGGHQRAG